jgi:hypothetical protein
MFLGIYPLEPSFHYNFNHLNPTSYEDFMLKLLTACHKICIVTILHLDCPLAYFTHQIILFSKLFYKGGIPSIIF